MIKETSLCMGCMNDKTYDGPCKLCGYSDNTPNIPTYLAPKTFLADQGLPAGTARETFGRSFEQ